MTNLPDITNTLTKSAVQNAANTFVPIQWADEVLAEREKKLFSVAVKIVTFFFQI